MWTLRANTRNSCSTKRTRPDRRRTHKVTGEWEEMLWISYRRTRGGCRIPSTAKHKSRVSADVINVTAKHQKRPARERGEEKLKGGGKRIVRGRKLERWTQLHELLPFTSTTHTGRQTDRHTDWQIYNISIDSHIDRDRDRQIVRHIDRDRDRDTTKYLRMGTRIPRILYLYYYDTNRTNEWACNKTTLELGRGLARRLFI